MFIALGLIGALWIVGAVIHPDKNGPGVFSQSKASTVATQQASPPVAAPSQH